MELLKKYALLPALIISSIANLLYIYDIVPELVFRIGFIIVMIISIVLNIFKSEKDLRDNFESKKILKYLLFIVAILWAVTLVIATFQIMGNK